MAERDTHRDRDPLAAEAELLAKAERLVGGARAAPLAETPAFGGALPSALLPALEETVDAVSPRVGADAPLGVGDTLGSVRLEAVLGEGGMGTVFRGYDAKLERAVAVKTVLAEARLGAAARARFQREAKLLSRLNHPSICQVYDLVERPEADYLLLELVAGETLRRFLEREPAPGAGARMAVALRLTEAIAAAHGAGVVHRDLKPENVMVTPDGGVKVLDFGIARLEERRAAAAREAPIAAAHDPAAETKPHEATGERDAVTAPSATELSRRIGTPAYMSPEQWRGEPAQAPADVWALGVVLHELFAGVRPFAPKPGAPAAAPPEIRIAPALDRHLARLVERMLATQPLARPTVAELHDRLAWIAARPARRRKRILGALAAAAAFAALGALVWSRIESARRSRLALEFAELASQIEWRLRAEYLAPLHDVSGVESEIRGRIAEFERRIAGLDPAVRATAHAAAGRAQLALGDAERARQHFQSAWDSGVRPPEVAFGLGRALAELYHERLQALGSSAFSASTAEYRAGLDRELAQPALALLRSARGASGAVPEHVESMIAAFEQRWDDAFAKARAAAARAPWLYEATLFEAAANRLQLTTSAQITNDWKLAHELSARALGAVERAAQVARSSPAILALSCESAAQVAAYEKGARLDRASGDQIDVAGAYCRDALVADPHSARAYSALAAVQLEEATRRQLLAETVSQSGLELAERTATRAIELDPGLAQAYYRRGEARRTRARLLFARGLPAPELAAAASSDLRRAAELEPEATWRRDLYLFGLVVQGMSEWWGGGDPEATLREVLLGAEEGLRVTPEFSRFAHRSAMAAMTLGRFYAERGREAIPLFERAVADCSRVLADTSHYTIASDCSLVQIDLGNLRIELGEDPGRQFDAARDWAESARTAAPTFDVPYFASGLAHAGDARWAFLHGRDSGPSLRRAIDAYDLGFARNAQNLEAYFEVAEFHLLAARHEFDAEASEPESLARARGRIEQGFAISSEIDIGQRTDASSWLLAALVAERAGRDPRPALLRAESAAERAVKNRVTAEAHSLLAAALVLRAGAELARGLDAGATLAATEIAVGRALELHPTHVRAVAAGIALRRLSNRSRIAVPSSDDAAEDARWIERERWLARERPFAAREHAALLALGRTPARAD